MLCLKIDYFQKISLGAKKNFYGSIFKHKSAKCSENQEEPTTTLFSFLDANSDK